LRAPFRDSHRGRLGATGLDLPVAVLQQSIGRIGEGLNVNPALDAVGAAYAPQLQPAFGQAAACLR
jgi:hypothetical protein